METFSFLYESSGGIRGGGVDLYSGKYGKLFIAYVAALLVLLCNCTHSTAERPCFKQNIGDYPHFTICPIL